MSLLLEFFTPAPVGSLLASTLWDASWNWALTALPLFIWMGEILFRTRLSSEMFKGLAPMLSNLPGGLLHVNVVGCGIMAAVAGSSAVTCATIGRMSIPELTKRKYDEIIYLTPDGKTLNQSVCNKLSMHKNLILLCGHYKGIDHRIRDLHITKEISIGDYVITGGEVAAARECGKRKCLCGSGSCCIFFDACQRFDACR